MRKRTIEQSKMMRLFVLLAAYGEFAVGSVYICERSGRLGGIGLCISFFDSTYSFSV